uniref:(northern house mosquito) hypothetical protein n=1 Tax=Culex pipiens TaxID=7175 RepID=A0A8D8BUK1_CULPI
MVEVVDNEVSVLVRLGHKGTSSSSGNGIGSLLGSGGRHGAEQMMLFRFFRVGRGLCFSATFKVALAGMVWFFGHLLTTEMPLSTSMIPDDFSWTSSGVLVGTVG